MCAPPPGRPGRGLQTKQMDGHSQLDISRHSRGTVLVASDWPVPAHVLPCQQAGIAHQKTALHAARCTSESCPASIHAWPPRLQRKFLHPCPRARPAAWLLPEALPCLAPASEPCLSPSPALQRSAPAEASAALALRACLPAPDPRRPGTVSSPPPPPTCALLSCSRMSCMRSCAFSTRAVCSLACLRRRATSASLRRSSSADCVVTCASASYRRRAASCLRWASASALCSSATCNQRQVARIDNSQVAARAICSLAICTQRQLSPGRC